MSHNKPPVFMCGHAPQCTDLGLQVDVSQRHFGHLVEADGQWDGAEDKQAVIDGDPHQDDGLDISRGHFDQQRTYQVDHQEEETDGQEDQVEREPCEIETERGLFGGLVKCSGLIL